MSKEPIKLATAMKRRNDGGSLPPANDTEGTPCPITALGHVDGKFWFLNSIGEKRGLSARQMAARTEITALFVGDTDWLRGRFPAKDDDGNVKGWSVPKAGEYFMQLCGSAGMYGEHVIIRRPGVWPGEDGGVIVHCGDALFMAGEKLSSGRKIAGQVFAAAARETYPARRPASRDTAVGFCDDIHRLWKSTQDNAEIIALGLVGQAYYAAALSWRSNGFITGGTNSGKSMLLDFLRAMVPMHHYTNDTSKAGVEGAVSGRALPSFIDESADGDPLAAQILLNIVLASSSGTGTKGHRGTADGGVRSIEVVGSVIMASVNTPQMQPQHRSRFAVIELVRPEAGADHKPQMEAAIKRARAAAPALFSRALDGFERFGTVLRVFRTALGVAGCVAREMDQLGSILAGHWILTEDGVPDEDAAAETVKCIADFVIGGEEMIRDSAPQAVLAILLSKIVNLHRSTDQDSIAALIRQVFRQAINPGEEDARSGALRVLRRWGLRPIRSDQIYQNGKDGTLVPRETCGNGLWIDPRVEPLRGIFQNTSYAGDRWIMELRRLPRTFKSRRNVRVSDLNSSTAIWITWEDVENGDDDTDGFHNTA